MRLFASTSDLPQSRLWRAQLASSQMRAHPPPPPPPSDWLHKLERSLLVCLTSVRVGGTVLNDAARRWYFGHERVKLVDTARLSENPTCACPCVADTMDIFFDRENPLPDA